MRADEASLLIDTQPAKVWRVLTDVAGWRGFGSHRRSSWFVAPSSGRCAEPSRMPSGGRRGGHPVGAHAIHDDAIRRSHARRSSKV